jgi:acyl-CoA reductase-like NAD-dependent aldehyde dehydrogenase
MNTRDGADLRPLLIGERWVQGSGEPLVSLNPADGEVNANVSTASELDIDAAVAAAVTALEASAWPMRLPHVRADHLHRIAQRLLDLAEPLGEMAMRENGKTLRECITQAKVAAGTFRYYASLCETLESQVTPSRGDYLSLTTHEPFGVVAAIVPWNSPVTLAADKLAPALAAGNAVVLKPSEVTSLVSLELGRICLEAGLPPGLVNVVPGTSTASSALVKHPGIGMVSFTGGTAAGRAVAHAAAERLIPVVLELGGKSPNIVFDDADLESAALGAAAAIFGSMGQSCIAGSRLFVHESIRERLMQRIVAIAGSIRLGPPAKETTQLGPLASFAHRDRVHGVVAVARREGARVVVGGSPPEGTEFEKGAYYRPTVLDGVGNESIACQTEIFGPVLCVLPFSDEDDVVKQANDTPYGLACGIWTNDSQKAWRVARRIQAGTVWINTYRQNSVATPFGGFKHSGWGRERGPQGLRQYQQVKSIFLGTSAKPLSLDR